MFRRFRQMIDIKKLQTRRIAACAIGLGVIVFLLVRMPASGARAQTGTSGTDAFLDYALHLNVSDYTTYTNSEYGFSFPYPADFHVSEIDDENSKEILFTGRFGQGIDILITPFDEDGPLTRERIAQDVLTLQMNDVVESETWDGIPIVRFTTPGPTGEIGEIWFSHQGNLYQIALSAPDKEYVNAWLRSFPLDLEFSDI